MTDILDTNPPESYQLAFSEWLNAHYETLCSLWSDFLAETKSSKHDEGCSIDEFCWNMFKMTKEGKDALDAINN